MPEAITLDRYPHDHVRIRCEKCGRDGRRSVSRLQEIYGYQAGLPDVLREEAACSRWTGASDPCGAHFTDLI